MTVIAADVVDSSSVGAISLCKALIVCRQIIFMYIKLHIFQGGSEGEVVDPYVVRSCEVMYFPVCSSDSNMTYAWNDPRDQW